MEELTIEDVGAALEGNAAAFRVITDLMPVGGDGDKLFPSTYGRRPDLTNRMIMVCHKTTKPPMSAACREIVGPSSEPNLEQPA